MKTQLLYNYQRPNSWLHRVKTASWLLPLSFFTSLALAVEVSVDSFNTDQAKLTDTTLADGGLSSSVLVDAGDPNGILGGERNIYVELLSSALPGLSVTTHVTDGFFSFSVDSLSTATASIQWDGPDGSASLDATGLGGIDITFGGTVDAFKVSSITTDHDFEFKVSVYSDATHYSQVTLLTLDNPPPVTSIPFSLFSAGACGTSDPGNNVISVVCGPDGAPDLTNVGALQADIDPDGKTLAVDLVLDSIYFDVPEPLLCRVTAGLQNTWQPGESTDLIEELKIDDTSESNVYSESNFYTAGGQAGAHTALQPQPSGEWTHTQHKGAAGKFTFHAGTASAPEGTEIDEIRCSDPGGCHPAGNETLPSPAKQIDFDGIGTFKNLGKGKATPAWLAGGNVTAEGKGNKTFDGTFHWFEVNMDDLGEPGNKGSENCPESGFGEKGVDGIADCACPDFYRITIYDGVLAADVIKNADGTIDKDQLNTTVVIYQVWGYIDGGNLQIHPLTGFDNP